MFMDSDGKLRGSTTSGFDLGSYDKNRFEGLKRTRELAMKYGYPELLGVPKDAAEELKFGELAEELEEMDRKNLQKPSESWNRERR